MLFRSLRWDLTDSLLRALSLGRKGLCLQWQMWTVSLFCPTQDSDGAMGKLTFSSLHTCYCPPFAQVFNVSQPHFHSFQCKKPKHILLNLYCIMLFTLFYMYCLLIYFLTVASVLKHLMFVYCILYLTSMLKALRFCSTCKLTGLVHAGRRQENSRSGTKDSLFLTVLAVIRVSLLLQLPRPYSYWAT